MSKGSTRRVCLVSSEEEQLRWDLAMKKITREEFDRRFKKIKRMKIR
jgi:hypothetical protein